MRTSNTKLTELKSNIGYIGFAKYSDSKTSDSIDITDIIRFLQIHFSVENVTKNRAETDHLPFPFRTENLTTNDIHKIDDNLLNEVKKIFLSFEKDWENFATDLNSFEFDLENVDIKLKELDFSYPCFMLTIDDFKPESDKIHALYNEMGYIYDYFFFIIFSDSNGEFMTLEISSD
ncbi:hypothetical protein SAMN05421855_1274 [Ulvibacter litoralis]|uniref:Uncharacterized protein n=2 Tax=Ulvibacter litoralis TaxID=227084 RepID=A0A1G7JSE3_9FLAO|nr:hypothetical protein GCM10008083_34040 [Ulvibacter litoralis]SDF27862.1 hypothetical protein SAMN05421855_1274 [Ulvibacter litoralis]